MAYKLLKKYETFAFKSTFYGGVDCDPTKLYDNLNPGPGTHDPNPHYPVPSYLIKDKQNFSRNAEKDKDFEPVGPTSHTPQYQYEQSAYTPKKGISIGKAVRREAPTTNLFTPAPSTYQILGDFDFKDATLSSGHPLQERGKVAKFAFGSRPIIKNKTIDFPGPAEYDTDTIPLNQKNLAYWIGTDVRRDMSVPYSHMYPGPGHYDPHEPNLGAKMS